MNRTKLSRFAAIPAAIAMSVVMAACSSSNESGGDGEESKGADSKLSGSLSGAGSSAQDAAMQAMIAGFTNANSGVSITYDPVGSGGGREQFVGGGTDFGGTDAYLDEEELAGAKKRCGDVIEIPGYISPIAVAFNLEGIDSLNLKPATIAQIFDQKIKKWNDEAIAADNPDVELPDLAITPVNRSDESGTTENFVEYLAAAAPDDWKHEVTGDWPVKGGEAGQGNQGVKQAVDNGKGAIGYLDASQVGELGTAKVGVGGEFVEYSPEAAAKVVEISERAPGRGTGGFAYDLQRDTTESGTYPIVLVSYNVACTTYDSKEKADLMKAFLSYVVSEEGQGEAAEAAGSAPISASLRSEIQPVLDGISAK
ncbi:MULTISPECIES: phosphate ABC transporter substrate-binding protein PstS [unclassified Streptomyces]|uniref:phosphate ABC transporter substrate-binding protein PstS n=1 Tax=unclassified Streptomyces TaxID=2593676 RepID=UPI0024A7D28E|nr:MULTISPECIES: phosphate ABC transporter substrate-binding protein PstS [unclassified Streptomyces]